MKDLNRICVLLLVCLLIAPAVFAANSGGAASAEQKAASAVSPDSSGFDVMLLMDSSGSMKKTDPHDFRKPAARLFISLLGENDNVGVIRFGDSAEVIAPLMPNIKANQGSLWSGIDKVSSKEFSTNITDAVKKGFDALRPSQRKNRIMVLLSDGKLALGSKEKDEAAHAELLGLLPDLKNAGIKIYSIAFTDMADMKLLSDVAMETGGFSKLSGTDREIHLIFASIFEKIKSPDAIPFEGDSFGVDKDIQEAILLITKKAGTRISLIDPANRRYTASAAARDMKWFVSDIFDMITIHAPAAGKWRVALSAHEGNEIFVITDLKLKSSFDRNFVKRGDRVKIDSWLEKQGAQIRESEILEQIVFYADVSLSGGQPIRLNLSRSAQAGGNNAADGVYSGEFLANYRGDYTVIIAAEGKTFKREKTFQFKVIEPVPSAMSEHKKNPVKTRGADVVTRRLAAIQFVAFALAVFFYLRNRKHKKLYVNILRELEAIKASAGAQPLREEMTPQEPETSAPPADSNKENEASLKGMINKLQRIVDFQKNKLLDLMTYIEILENAQEKLSAIQQGNRDLQERFKQMAKSPDKHAEFEKTLRQFDKNTDGLEAYLNIFKKENQKLSGQFRVWEDELKKMWQDEGYDEVIIEADRNAEISQEKERLMSNVRELEEKLQAKGKQVESLQEQNKSLEQEYTILYKQQQASQKNPHE